MRSDLTREAAGHALRRAHVPGANLRLAIRGSAGTQGEQREQAATAVIPREDARHTEHDLAQLLDDLLRGVARDASLAQRSPEGGAVVGRHIGQGGRFEAGRGDQRITLAHGDAEVVGAQSRGVASVREDRGHDGRVEAATHAREHLRQTLVVLGSRRAGAGVRTEDRAVHGLAQGVVGVSSRRGVLGQDSRDLVGQSARVALLHAPVLHQAVHDLGVLRVRRSRTPDQRAEPQD